MEMPFSLLWTPEDLSLPKWLGDETLFSYISRYHQMSCNVNPQTTSRQLLGHVRTNMHSNSLTGLQHFAEVTEGSLGSAEDIARERTSLFVTVGFSAENVRTRSINSVVFGSRITPFSKAYFTRATAPPTPLRACPRCIHLDVRDYGYPIWHQSHQTMGINFCTVHDVLLAVEADKTRNGSIGTAWYLPEAARLQPRRSIQNKSTRVQVRKLNEVARAFADDVQKKMTFDPNLLQAVYRQRLQENGFARSNGRFKRTETLAGLKSLTADLRRFRLYSWLGQSDEQLTTQFGFLFKKNVMHANTITHLILITFLYGNWDEFLQCYFRANSSVQS